MKNIFKLRIDAKLANVEEDTFTNISTTRIKKRNTSSSPLTKCTGTGAHGSTNCILRANHLCLYVSRDVSRGSYLPMHMKPYVLKEHMDACKI